jgi:cytochrome c
MNFFDELVIPPSDNHVMLLKYMLTISLLLFIPYISMMLGATFISTYFSRKGKTEGNNLYLRFAKDVVEKLTITKSAELALGTIPALSAFFAYAQLLYTAKTISIGMLALSVVLFIVSFVFIYKYRNTFKLEGIMKAFKSISSQDALKAENDETKEIKEFEENIIAVNNTSGTVGKWLLLTASYIFAGTMALASSPDKWNSTGNILQIIFSWQTLFSFMTLISLAGIISGAAIMFFFFSWNGGVKHMSDEYSALVKVAAGKIALASGIMFPLMLLISYAYLPQVTQSPTVFYYMVIVLIISLVLGNFIYSMFKNSDTSSATVVFVLVFVLVTFNVIKDQIAFGNAIHDNTLVITKLAEEEEKEVKGKTMENTGIDAQSIFNQKCSACHKFDQKLVGPPYDQTIPKYNGDATKLAEFIFNPQKIDPAYPPMPNQGLKKKEANAMAQWLINKVGKK